MRSSSYLLSLKIFGIKNIENEIKLDFYKKGLDSFNPREYNVKSIYGENGTGKSALMTATSILKEVAINNRFFNEKSIILLDNLINKRKKTLSIEAEYIIYDEGDTKEKNYLIYRYGIKINSKKGIISEALEKKNNKTWKTLYSVKNGLVVKMVCADDVKQYFIENSENLLNETSFLSWFRKIGFKKYIRPRKHETAETVDIMLGLINSNSFFSNLYIYLEDEDIHDVYINMKNLVSKAASYKKGDSVKDIENFMFQENMLSNYKFGDASTLINKDEINIFQKEINKLYLFIKIFKPELKKIKIDKREVGNSYKCELIFCYKNYEINQEFESNGIKKLIRLFVAFKQVEKGSTVFIDELDSNLHDVYLCRLIEYFGDYSKGQLCFTTHNMGPMDVLSKRKNSIDFISRDGSLVSWKKNGNYTVKNLYRNGYIEKSPFNIESFDFLPVFSGEQK